MGFVNQTLRPVGGSEVERIYLLLSRQIKEIYHKLNIS